MSTDMDLRNLTSFADILKQMPLSIVFFNGQAEFSFHKNATLMLPNCGLLYFTIPQSYIGFCP